MPPAKKKTASSGDKSIQAISAELSKLATELDELRARPTEEVLEQRARELKDSVAVVTDFKTRLEDLCERFQTDLEDLFCENLWERIPLSR